MRISRIEKITCLRKFQNKMILIPLKIQGETDFSAVVSATQNDGEVKFYNASDIKES